MLRQAAILVLGLPISAQAQPWTAIVLHPDVARASTIYALGQGFQAGTCVLLLSGQPEGGFWLGSPRTWTPFGDPQVQSYVVASDGARQVGSSDARAALWRGTPGSLVDLHPTPATGVYISGLSGVSGGMQVGQVLLLSGYYHAGLWRGSPESFIDLNPIGALESQACATDGILQGGAVRWTARLHAAIWNGTPASIVDLNPAGATGDSWVQAMAPGVQVGYVTIGSQIHAALWHGTAQSFVDLSPGGVTSYLYGTTGRVHAGEIPQNSLTRAAINFGTPQSWLGLHQFLPPQFNSFSVAHAVFQDGPTIYVGGSAQNAITGYDQAILWIGPDPCYANCDQSTIAPVLNVNDFLCFLSRFAGGDPYANCDGSTSSPNLNVNDFVCFLNKFAAGCP